MNPEFIEFKGKKILYVNYRNVRDKDVAISILKRAVEIERKSEGDLLILQNYEGTYANQEFMGEIKKLGKEVKEKVKKNALVGITGIKKILLQTYSAFSGEKNIKTFNTEEDAKEWLILDEKS
ncbi:MAG: hypothetical protein JXJ04_06825 [Spirochaetales bacterium]|nr:hypothetical protein [Spirochaetales bacterium]